MRSWTCFAGGAAVSAVITAFAFGPLNPPAGPVAPSNKTLQEIEPRIPISATNTPGDADSVYRISQPGSYYLTSNITGVAGKHGIEIAVSGVRLDLNGFTLIGVAGSLDGVRAAFALANIAVENGSLRAWGENSVNLGDFADGCRVQNVSVADHGLVGIHAGANARVLDCSSRAGTHGIYVKTGCTLSNCSVRFASDSGFYVEQSATLNNCAAVSNQGSGFTIGTGSTVSNCAAYGNGIGMVIGPMSAVTNCSSSSNSAEGFSVASGSTETHCTASSNFGHGIVVDSRCTVSDCTSEFNSGDGIVCNRGCLIRANTSARHFAGAAIHVAQSDNRIEGNNCTNSSVGIKVDDSPNILIRNTCRSNTPNWDVIAGNICLAVQGATAPAILGSTGGVAPGSTDPNANFSY